MPRTAESAARDLVPSLARPGRGPWCPAWGLALTSLVAAGAVMASNPHLMTPEAVEAGGFRLRVAATDGTPLTAERADRIVLLHTTNLGEGPGSWRPVDGSRRFEAGILQLDWPGLPGTTPHAFFLAQESAPPPVTVNTAAAFRSAVASAQPGTRILLAPGTYPGGFAFSRLRGAPGQPVVLGAADPSSPPVIQGGANGIQLTDPEWVVLEDLVFSGATSNGLNVDDGGSFETPARNLVLRRLRITDVGPLGNRDGIKLSGVVDFRVEDCTVERWGNGGSAVDMVGCHRGVIERNAFRHTPGAAATGANGVQTKGGSRDVVVRRNRFENTGARGVNIGGSTGLEFFRPALVSGEPHWEARDITVEGNTFLGSAAPVAFVGVDGAVVRFNTIYRPERWAVRILQENTANGFVPCRGGVFTDNLVAFHSSQWSSGGVNVGANTAPGSFQFARNWWYCLDAPTRSRPTLPTAESAGTYGQDPRFRDPAQGDVRLEADSPARGVGADALP